MKNTMMGGMRMTRTNKKSNRMVYTPECHIPVGEAVMMENGEPALRIKKPKGQEYEVVTLGKLFAAVSQKANATV